ncbi:CBS domain-containing protein [Candidatus Thiodubiliella endoseptemdiera]|uniref:CBS domain-containing protein n=1 Tax=Candidatus Thiodubiliella endoseptemdiera TaxID=2738886 RepID=A0A853F4Q1_9GAMM|nr:CBS domain-containing protein [Candidatus Thiodubiliella endoseptemdiera]
MNTPVLVRDVMWKEVDIIDSKSTVEDALNDMQHKKTKMLIIDKAHQHDEYGVVLISDIAAKVIAEGRALDRVNAYEIMTKPIISVHPDMEIRYCARFLTRLGLSRCPVIDGGKVIGVVSLTNIVLNGLHVV